MEDELLFFKRFPKEKQDQVRGLVEYATLMGLSGRDLVSIGGKLDRIKASQEKARNLEIVKSVKILPIGDDKRYKGSSLEDSLDNRFKIKTTTGSYNFSCSYSKWTVKSTKTGITQHHSPDNYSYELGNTHWSRRSRYAMILDIANGLFQLNF